MRQEISGDLSNTRIPEIIKILSLGKRTGRLFVTNGSETGNIFFSEGRVVHAHCASLSGIKAVEEAAVWSSGEYQFFPDEQADVQTIIMDVDDILADVTNHLRQMNKITSLIPSAAAVYSLETDPREREIQIKAAQWKVISLVDGRRSIADIAQMAGLAVSDAMKVFYTLLRMGLLREASEREEKASRADVNLPETAFVNRLVDALTHAVGPIAPYLVEETATELATDLITDNPEEKALIVETISGKIPNEKMSLKFLDVMTEHLRQGA